MKLVEVRVIHPVADPRDKSTRQLFTAKLGHEMSLEGDTVTIMGPDHMVLIPMTNVVSMIPDTDTAPKKGK